MLSSTSEYALRALAELARLSRGEFMLGRDLAKQTGIPSKYLSKIMLALRNAGLVAATRGAGGGYMLQRPADAIHLTDIVQVFEGAPETPTCLLRGNHECNGEDHCTAHNHWHKVRASYAEFLEQTTLIDISMNTHDSQITATGRKPVLN
jgi:Rrf2 family transcriptional regulator, iron-sulfur cluster assembly transcription factor